jgi:hypothetical protein
LLHRAALGIGQLNHGLRQLERQFDRVQRMRLATRTSASADSLIAEFDAKNLFHP